MKYLTEEQVLKLSRDYDQFPLKKKELICLQDCKYLFLELNLSISLIKEILNCSYEKVSNSIHNYSLAKTPEQIKESKQQTCLLKYGVKNVAMLEDVKIKTKEKMLNKYKSEHFCTSKYYNKNKEMKKRKQTNLKKFGVEHPLKLKEYKDKQKETVQQKYNVENVSQLDSVKDKRKLKIKEITNKSNHTKQKNKTYLKSKAEDEVYVCLCNLYGKENVIRQYMSEDYPFLCDFYITSKDLYIEYQGFWNHGNEPFNPRNPKHQEFLKSLKGKKYEKAILAWTDYDVKKRELARQNNLNYLEFFNLKEFKNWYNKQRKEDT